MKRIAIEVGLFLVTVGLSCSLMFPLANLMPRERPGGQFIPGSAFIMLPAWCLSLLVIGGIMSLIKRALIRLNQPDEKKKNVPPPF